MDRNQKWLAATLLSPLALVVCYPLLFLMTYRGAIFHEEAILELLSVTFYYYLISVLATGVAGAFLSLLVRSKKKIKTSLQLICFVGSGLAFIVVWGFLLGDDDFTAIHALPFFAVSFGIIFPIFQYITGTTRA